ncbi:MAG: adenosylcobinamide-phosphate synthase CbiB [Aliishimia sp.]
MTLAAILTVAMILDAIFGEPRWLWSRIPHPAILMGRLLSGCERLLYRDTRAAGVLVLCICVGLVFGLAWALTLLGPVIQSLCAAVLLAHRALIEHVRRVADDLRVSLDAAKDSVAMIVSRDTATLTEQQVARAAIESAAENMSDGVIAPVFWFLIAGLPGLCVYKMVNTADSMIGYQTDRYLHFGWAAARFDDVLNWIPARLTGLAFWLLGGCVGTWHDIATEARQHKSPNAGWPEAALSRAIGIALAGPRPYHGVLQELPWVNPKGIRDISAPHIDAALVQLWRVWTLFVIICIGFALVL